jgi:ureidoglycolate hydrolase
MKELKPIELTSESFKDYGTVLSQMQSAPIADNVEFKYWEKISHLSMGMVASTGVLIGKKRDTILKCLERHITTPEVLVALEGDSIICVGKPTETGGHIIDDIKAFNIKQGDAFAMHAGTWHWIPYPTKDEQCKLLVIFSVDTEKNDLEVKNLIEEIKVCI